MSFTEAMEASMHLPGLCLDAPCIVAIDTYLLEVPSSRKNCFHKSTIQGLNFCLVFNWLVQVRSHTCMCLELAVLLAPRWAELQEISMPEQGWCLPMLWVLNESVQPEIMQQNMQLKRRVLSSPSWGSNINFMRITKRNQSVKVSAQLVFTLTLLLELHFSGK